MSISYLIGVVSSLSASVIFILINQIFSARKELRSDYLGGLMGDWNLYRYAVKKHTEDILHLNLSIKKKRFMRGVYFEFKTKYIEGGIYKGAVKIKGRIATCIFNGDEKNEPFMISIYDHSISEVKNLRVGVIAGVAAVSNMPYASKFLMSRSEVPVREVSALINKASTIKITDDLSPILEFQSRTHNNLR